MNTNYIATELTEHTEFFALRRCSLNTIKFKTRALLTSDPFGFAQGRTCRRHIALIFTASQLHLKAKEIADYRKKVGNFVVEVGKKRK
jgi:hypothetical protein